MIYVYRVKKTTVHLIFFCESSESSVCYFQPCYVRKWELHVQFKVHGGGKSLFGDGFAIWYTKDRMKSGNQCLFHFTHESDHYF